MIYPVVDVGSNTVRLCVYDYDGFLVKTLFTKKAMVGLAGHCNEGKMTQAGVEKLCETLQKFQDTLDNFETAPMAVFATASLRNVENAAQVLEIVRRRTGVSIEIITGEEEARLDFIGATAQQEMQDGILVDIGGGSTELVLFAHGEIQKAVSVPIGSLNSYAQHVSGFLPTAKERRKIRKTVEKALDEVWGDITIQPGQLVCGVGGTVRAVCKLSNRVYDLPTGHQQISKFQIDEVYEVLTHDQRHSVELILDVVPDRLRTIVTGLTILRTVMKYCKGQAVQVSQYGVREGYLYSRIIRAPLKKPIIAELEKGE